MTKEMRPNHRVDVLSDALLFYAKKKSANIGWVFKFLSKSDNSFHCPCEPLKDGFGLCVKHVLCVLPKFCFLKPQQIVILM